jgi:hypothetical protein
MIYVIAAISFGTLAYVALFLFQSPQSRRDSDAWGELLFVSGMLTTFLVVAMFWGMLGDLTNTSLATVIDGMLWKESSGTLRVWTVVGFAAVPFTVLSAVHVLALKVLAKSRRQHAA